MLRLEPSEITRRWADAAGVHLARSVRLRRMRVVGNSPAVADDNARWSLAALTLGQFLGEQVSIKPSGDRLIYRVGPFALRTTSVDAFAIRRSDPDHLPIIAVHVGDTQITYYGFMLADEARAQGDWYPTDTPDGGFYKVPIRNLYEVD